MIRIPRCAALSAALSAALGAALALAACAPAPPDVARLTEPAPAETRTAPPPGADPDTCWGQDATPAVVETVTEQVMVAPAEVADDGTVLGPAVYRTETRQAIVERRREVWFEAPCPRDLTPDFLASVQRALQVRGHYDGPIDGRLSPRTRRAIRAYQKPQGLESGILSTAAARRLGLVAIARPPQG